MKAGYDPKTSLIFGVLFGPPLIATAYSLLPMLSIYAIFLVSAAILALMLILPFWIFEITRARGRKKRREASAERKSAANKS